MIVVEKMSDIRHCLESAVRGNLTVDSLEDQFENRAAYMAHCRDNGAKTIYNLVCKERAKISNLISQMCYTHLSMYGRALVEQ